MSPSTNMAKCKFIGDECTFTSDLVFKQLRAKKVTFYDSLQLALDGNTPIELLISWAKKHLNESDILVTTRGSMTITSLISQLYQGDIARNCKTQEPFGIGQLVRIRLQTRKVRRPQRIDGGSSRAHNVIKRAATQSRRKSVGRKSVG